MLFSVIRCLVAFAVCTTWLLSTAMAAPPAECVKKHAGRWQITVRATGQTYPADLFPNGTGVSYCPGCAPGTWTCSGNTSTVFVNGITVVSTLSPDGRSASSGCCTSTRIGGAPAAAAAAPERTAPPKTERPASDQPAARRDPAPPKQTAERSSAPAATVKSVRPSSTSCSDITGTGSTAPAATNCRNADRALYAARQIRQSNPQLAATEYKKAAEAARRAGDSQLELSILRETMEAIPAVAAALAGHPRVEPQGAANTTARATGLRPLWDGRTETCDTASDMEKATAGWYTQCVLSKLPKTQPAKIHRPDPDPADLNRAARQACGSYSADTQQCFTDFKMKAVLAKHPEIDEFCRRTPKAGQLRAQLREKLRSTGQSSDTDSDAPKGFSEYHICVDNLYLYGTPRDTSQSVRDLTKDALRKQAQSLSDASARANATSTAAPRSQCWAPGWCCAPGQGLKPDRKANGAWTCQTLGLFTASTANPRLDAKQDADLKESFEQRVDDVVANAVTAAIEALGPALSARDRDACLAVAFTAAWSLLKGGTAAVPEACRPLANAARGHVGYYADVHLDNSSPAMEELLASFRSDLGSPLPGMTGLTPDETMRRTGDCMIRGVSAEDCK
jgi:hypothetical protein